MGKHLIDHRDLGISEAHDTVSFLVENLARLFRLAPEHHIHTTAAELHVILNQDSRTAALLGCRSE